MNSRIVMRELRLEDEPQVVAIHSEMVEKDNFSFLLSDYVRGEQFSEYLKRVEAYKDREKVPNGKVVSTFLVAIINGRIVGRISIRHTLNDFLALTGGHIGYGVAPASRGRGVATDMLKYGIEFCRNLGIEQIYITCRVSNAASRAVIEKCGGEFSRIVQDPNKGNDSFRTYWIPTSV